MTSHLIAIFALACLCASWVIVQRFITRHDPEIGQRVEKQHGGCNTCGLKDEKSKDAGCSGQCEEPS